MNTEQEVRLHGPFKTDDFASYIYGSNDKIGGDNPVLEIRGWGYLTGNGHGALGLSHAEAVAEQKRFASFVVDALNAASPPAVAAGGVTVDPDLLAKQSTIEPDIAAVVYPNRSKLYSDFSGGVTDQAVEAACKAFYGEAAWQFPRGIISKPSSIIAMRRALTAALAVGDEGIREDDTIRVCPERDARCPHGMSCPYNHDRYRCDMIGSRAGLKDTTHAE